MKNIKDFILESCDNCSLSDKQIKDILYHAHFDLNDEDVNCDKVDWELISNDLLSEEYVILVNSKEAKAYINKTKSCIAAEGKCWLVVAISEKFDDEEAAELGIMCDPR